jgi:hypothetical protein
VNLTLHDMKGSPLPLIAKLQAKYCHFGAVKLTCPAEWSPPMEFKHPKEALTTRIQPIHQLKLGKVLTFSRFLRIGFIPFRLHHLVLRIEEIGIFAGQFPGVSG